MRLIINKNTDPFFNLACEEYLMLNEGREVFMLWQNGPSVIIGANQNAYAEVNLSYAEEKGIKVARRLTGGGAVYHDLGNINFSVITDEKGEGIDFAAFLDPIVKALRDLGVDAELNGRNDITVNGLKISGNAQGHKHGKILHHGTLLYKTDKETMSAVLNVSSEKLKSKGIASVRSRVGEIKDMVNLSIDGLISYLATYFDTIDEPLSEGEIKGITSLAKEKYGTWEHIFGASKALEKTVKKRFIGGSVEIGISSEGGMITQAYVRGDFFSVGEPRLIEEALVGVRLDYTALVDAISASGCDIYGISPSDIASVILE